MDDSIINVDFLATGKRFPPIRAPNANAIPKAKQMKRFI